MAREDRGDDSPASRELERAWESVRALALRDFSQSEDLHKGAPTALGTKSQPAGGIPMPPRDLPLPARVMGGAEDFLDESAMRFGYEAGLGAGPSGREWNEAVEARLRVDWETQRSQRRDWEQVKPFVRHGWQYATRR